jgi:hypothetical protein
MGYLKTSEYFDVPQTTLKRYVKQSLLSPTEEASTKLGRKPDFLPNPEADLTQHCLLMEERFFGITRADLRSLAYHLAVNNNLPNSFNVPNEPTGKSSLKVY